MDDSTEGSCNVDLSNDERDHHALATLDTHWRF